MVEKKLDYNKLGLKSGLEIHQQLDTKKLFCNCPSLLRKEKPDFKVKRMLHAVAGESGEVDVAAKYQAGLNTEFIYEGYDTTCLVELDESPPRKINLYALKIALQISILLNCKIIPITQVMRKTVIDGSNTSGFQRTVLIARNGYIETSQGKVGIDTVCLEEDSARIINRKKGIFRLDRLGIPLIEIATKPDIKSPEQARETALHIGEILRSCKVKRGLGTIRQDVNLSIKGGKRIELKGFQDIRNIEKAIEIETRRQRRLVEKNKSKEEVRKVHADGSSEFLRPLPGAARMYPETDLPLLKISRQKINKAKKNLPQLKKDIKEELKSKGLNKEMSKLVMKENKVEEFKELLNIFKHPNLVAKILMLYPKEISSRYNISEKNTKERLNLDVLESVLESLKKEEITRDDIKHALTKIAKGEDVKKVLKILSEDKIPLNLIEEKIHKLIKEKPGLSENAYMGLVMKEFKGKVSGKHVMEIIKRHVS